MPYHSHRDSFGGDFGGDLAGSLVAIGIVVLVIAFFLAVKAIVFVCVTYAKYPQGRKAILIALAICVVSCIAGYMLDNQLQSGVCLTLVGLGCMQLLICTSVVDLSNRDTLLRENVHLIDEVLHTPWWGSEDTPLQEQEMTQVAA